MHANPPSTAAVQSRIRRPRVHARTLIATVVALTVVLGCTPRSALQFSPTTLPDGHIGSPYAATITVSQAATPVGGASIQDGSLPAGLVLELAKQPADTIQISGTPTIAGTFNFTISVWCYGTNVGGQTATQAYVIGVK
jgi:hypothetical protein